MLFASCSSPLSVGRGHKEEESAAVQAYLERLMEEKGVEDLEELYERFIETEHAHIPVPGLHRGKPVSFEVFERLAARRHPYIYSQLWLGVAEALGLTEEETFELGRVYFLGEPPKV